MTLVPKTSVIPPGGFHFIDSTSGVPFRVEGHDEASVVDAIAKHRSAANLPPGYPLQEYREWLCSAWPHFCTGGNAQVEPSLSGGEHISKRVAEWISVFFRTLNITDLVSQQEAERRAEICSRCPKNIVYNDSGCGSCLQTIEQLSLIYKANRQTPFDRELRACSAIGQHNGTAVWAKSLPPHSADVPQECWRK